MRPPAALVAASLPLSLLTFVAGGSAPTAIAAAATLRPAGWHIL